MLSQATDGVRKSGKTLWQIEHQTDPDPPWLVHWIRIFGYGKPKKDPLSVTNQRLEIRNGGGPHSIKDLISSMIMICRMANRAPRLQVVFDEPILLTFELFEIPTLRCYNWTFLFSASVRSYRKTLSRTGPTDHTGDLNRYYPTFISAWSDGTPVNIITRDGFARLDPSGIYSLRYADSALSEGH